MTLEKIGTTAGKARLHRDLNCMMKKPKLKGGTPASSAPMLLLMMTALLAVGLRTASAASAAAIPRPAGAVSSYYEAPDDCEWSFVDDTLGYLGGVALTCNLAAINSEAEKTNFSVIPAKLTRKLKVRCRGSGEQISRLEPGGFARLGFLEELAIEGCTLQHIPALAFQGLERLQRLTLHPNPGQYLGGGGAPPEGLAVGIDAFMGLTALTHLDLRFNSIRSIPQGELCHLGSLQHLDLSENKLGSVDDLGLPAAAVPCLPDLQNLDLSKNEVTALNSSLFTHTLAKLRVLRASSNYIRHVQTPEPEEPEKMATGSCDLVNLDLSDNQISGLPATFLRSCDKLAKLNLANNSLSGLEVAAFFHGQQKSLATLDLSGNRLDSATVSAELAEKLESLEELVLSHNLISSIRRGGALAGGGRSGISLLRVLKLDGNRIESIQDEAFRHLANLTELDLGGNRLSSMSAHTLKGLSGLTHLNLGNNAISEVEDGVFRDCPSLLVLDLSHNRLNSSPEALDPLSTVLQTLDLSFNGISNLVNASFLRMEKLWRLQLNSNGIVGGIETGLFKSMESLQILDLSSNGIRSVETGALDAAQKLQAVRLDDNQLTGIEGLFQNLPNLRWLNVSSNHIARFDYAFLPMGLKWLDISHNSVRELANYHDLTSGQLQLSELDASFNALSQLGPHNIPDSIEILAVNDNRISQIVPYTFFKKSKLAKVDLTVNELRILDRNSLRLSSDMAQLPDFYLTGNPIECDCEMVWLKSINSANNLQSYPVVKDIESIYCRLVHTRQETFVPLVEAHNDQFLCPYRTHCFALCQCCDFDACDCEMTCPDNCTCYHDGSWSKNIAECSSGEFYSLPDQLPMDATEIFLDGNIFPELQSHTFIGRKNLKVLHLNNSQVRTIQNMSFNGLHSLTALHLHDNQLTSLKGFEFNELDNLRELYLDGNLIQFIQNATFKALKNLEILTLHNNRLTDFPVWQLAFNPFLISVSLGENFWSCSCAFAERFKSWMAVYGGKIYDVSQITCESNLVEGSTSRTDRANGAVLKMADVSQATCIRPSDDATSAGRQGEALPEDPAQGNLLDDHHLPLMAATLASFAVVLLVLLVLFIYRNNLRVWIFAKYGVRVCSSSGGGGGKYWDNDDPQGSDEEAASSGKLFDALISYSPMDDEFVRNSLLPKLESVTVGDVELLSSSTSSSSASSVAHRPSSSCYRIGLYHSEMQQQHQQHHVASETILHGVEASSRTILVLSENFIKSEWSRYDYKSALHQAFRQNSSKNKRLIIITLGGVSGRDVDPDLRLYLKNSLVLNWGDGMFWQRLRYALPDVTPADRKRTRRPPPPSGSSSGPIIGVLPRCFSNNSPNSTVVSSVDSSATYHYPQCLYGGPPYGQLLQGQSRPLPQQPVYHTIPQAPGAYCNSPDLCGGDQLIIPYHNNNVGSCQQGYGTAPGMFLLPGVHGPLLMSAGLIRPDQQVLMQDRPLQQPPIYGGAVVGQPSAFISSSTSGRLPSLRQSPCGVGPVIGSPQAGAPQVSSTESSLSSAVAPVVHI